MKTWLAVPILAALALAVPATPKALSAQEDAFILEGLVVTGSATPRPVDAVANHVTVVEGEALRAAGITRISEALRRVPGLAVVQNGGVGAATSLFMRGGESDYVLVLVDGVQVNLPGGAFDFSGLTTANLERIEVVRGPASALYGSDAMAGVVHVITRTGGGAPSGGVSTRVGSYATREWAADMQGGGDSHGYSLSLSRMSTDGVLPVNNEFANTVLSGAARFAPDEATRVRLTLRLSDRAYHFPTDGSGSATDANAFTFGDETVAGLTVSRRITSVVDLAATVGVSEFDGGTDDAPDGAADTLGFYGFTSLDHLRRAQADVRAGFDFGGAVVSVGWEVEEERQRSFTESLSQYGPSTGRSENARWNRAYYGQLTGERGSLAFNAGARLEDNERFGSLGTWQFGARLRPWEEEGFLVRASLGQGIKEPTFYENFATGFAVGNPELDPERATSWEVGVEHALVNGRLRLQATYFAQDFQDLIQYTFSPAEPGGPNFYNVAAAEARGVEVHAQIGGDAWDLSGSWTHLATEVVDAGFDEGPEAGFVLGESLLRRPANQVGLAAAVRMGRWGSVSGAADFLGERDDRDFSSFPAERVTLPSHLLLGLGVEVPLRGQRGGGPVDLLLRATNLLDEAYEEVLGFAAPGRTLSVGLRLRFGGQG